MTQLQAGCGKTDITPPLGVELSGYGLYLNRKSKAVRAPLLAKSLVLRQGETRVALVAADLLAISASMAARVRAAVEAATGIPADNVLIACSHTHSGPATLFLRGCGEVDSGYVEMLPRYLAASVIEAAAAMEPVRVAVGKATLDGLAINRVDPDGEVDAALQTLEFIGIDSGRRTTLFTFGCHPLTTARDDAEIGPDFPGEARRLLEACVCENALFLQGSCGDINSRFAFTGLEGRDRAARLLAGATLTALGQAEILADPGPLRCARRIVELPLNLPTREELERKRDEHHALAEANDPNSEEGKRGRFGVEATESLLAQLTGESDPWLEILRDAQDSVRAHAGREPRLSELAESLDLPPEAVINLLRLQKDHSESGYSVPNAVGCELQAIQLGDIVLLAHPTELFASFGLEIKRRSPFAHIFVLGFANDALGYLPDEADFAREGYAATVVPYLLDQFPYAPNVGRVFAEACLSLLAELR